MFFSFEYIFELQLNQMALVLKLVWFELRTAEGKVWKFVAEANFFPTNFLISCCIPKTLMPSCDFCKGAFPRLDSSKCGLCSLRRPGMSTPELRAINAS